MYCTVILVNIGKSSNYLGHSSLITEVSYWQAVKRKYVSEVGWGVLRNVNNFLGRDEDAKGENSRV